MCKNLISFMTLVLSDNIKKYILLPILDLRSLVTVQGLNIMSPTVEAML